MLFTAVCLLNLVFLFCVSAQASPVKVLSDRELDSIHAEGISFEYDISFGTIWDFVNFTVSNINKPDKANTVQKSPGGQVTLFNNFSAQDVINQAGQAQSAIAGKVVEQVKNTLVNPIEQIVEVIDNLVPDIVPSASAPAAVAQENLIPAVDLVAGSALAVNNPVSGGGAAASGQTGTVGPAVQSVPGGQPVLTDTTTVAAAKPVEPDYLQLDVAAGLGGDAGQITAGLNALSTSIQTAPNNADAAAQNSNSAASVSQTPAASAPPGLTISPVGNSGYNSVVVDDYSQQFLSALVNVNAAGSIVPVMLNITININSTVGSISNANSLDLRNYCRFQLD